MNMHILNFITKKIVLGVFWPNALFFHTYSRNRLLFINTLKF